LYSYELREIQDHPCYCIRNLFWWSAQYIWISKRCMYYMWWSPKTGIQAAIALVITFCYVLTMSICAACWAAGGTIRVTWTISKGFSSFRKTCSKILLFFFSCLYVCWFVNNEKENVFKNNERLEWNLSRLWS